MSKRKNIQAASSGDELVGFAQFASKRKRGGGASVGNNGFAKFVDKKKGSQDANVGDEEGLVLTKKTIEKAGYTEKVRMRRLSSLSENIPAKSEQRLPANSGQRVPANSRQEGLVLTKKTIEKSGYTDKVRMRRLSSLSENIPAQSEQRLPANSGQRVPANSGRTVAPQSVVCLPAHSGRAPSHSTRVPAHYKQSVSNQLEQITKPDQLQICVPTQSRLHSPVHSRQRASQSGQSTPEQSRPHSAQSRPHSAQSRQHTPEAQSRKRTPDAAQSEPIGHTPTPSHPSTLNVSSTAGNDNVCWNIGTAQSDGRVRVEVINKVLEPSHQCSSKIRQIMYEKLEPTGYNWKSVSKEAQSFYFEEFKKYFAWRQSDAIIYQGWLANARKKYSELCCVAHSDWENNKQPDNRIGMNVYLSWIEFWKTPEFKKKSEIQKYNRCSGVDGRPSTHTSGSASHRTVAARMKLSLNREPTADELFRETHIRHLKKKKNLSGLYDEDEENDGDGENDKNSSGENIWIDKKSQQTYVSCFITI